MEENRFDYRNSRTLTPILKPIRPSFRSSCCFFSIVSVCLSEILEKKTYPRFKIWCSWTSATTRTSELKKFDNALESFRFGCFWVSAFHLFFLSVKSWKEDGKALFLNHEISISLTIWCHLFMYRKSSN